MSENESYVVLNIKESTVKIKKKAEAKEKKVNKKEEKSKSEVEKKEKKERKKNEEEEDKKGKKENGEKEEKEVKKNVDASKKKVVLADKNDSEEKKKKETKKIEKSKSEKGMKIEEEKKPEPNPDLIFFEMIPERPVLKPRGTVEVKFKNTGGFRIEMVISLYSIRMRLHNSQICKNDSTVHRVVEPGATASVLVKDTGVYCGYESGWVPPYDPNKRDGQLTLRMMSVHASVTEMRLDGYVNVCDREVGGCGCNAHVLFNSRFYSRYEEQKNMKKNVGYWKLDYTTFVTMEPESKSYKEQLERIKHTNDNTRAKGKSVFEKCTPKRKGFVPPRTEESMKKRLEKRIAEEKRLKAEAEKRKTEAEKVAEEKKKIEENEKKCIIS